MTVNRSEVVTALVTAISAAATPISVSDGEPRELNREHIWVADIHPERTSLAEFAGPRLHYDDMFTIDVEHWAGEPGQSASEARQRAQALGDYTREVLATQSVSVSGLLSIYVANSDGPNVRPSDDEGYTALETIHVHCESALD